MSSETTLSAPQEQMAWDATLMAYARREGVVFERLGAGHSALLVEDGTTLLVSFEHADDLSDQPDHLPMSCVLAEEAGWSSLSLITTKNDWFRASQVYGFFDRMVDDGFFDGFDRVVFYGEGMCGYAAAAFSVTAPGATVIAISPQATLDPRVTEWDPRFAHKRRISFTDRYGYAPDMLEAARQAYILYDPLNTLDAMHAALFTRPNVTKLRCRYMDDRIADDLNQMAVLPDLIDAACEGKLEAAVFHRLFRARRGFAPYLRQVLAHLETADRPYLTALLCHNVSSRMRAPRFRKRLKDLRAQFEAEGRPLPWADQPEDEIAATDRPPAQEMQ